MAAGAVDTDTGQGSVSGTDQLSRGAVRVILAGLFTGVFMSALDSMIMATALRTVADSLHGLTAQAWITTTYLMAMTISAPLYGKLSDIFGRKRLYLVSVGLFMAGSLLCSLAQAIYQLALFRGVQGLGAGGLAALPMAAIADLFPPAKRIRHQANVGILYGIASVIGPVLGGLLAGADTFAGIDGWRWIFLINLPIGLVTFVIVARLFTLRPPKVDRRVDYGGALALVVALVPALLVTEQGSEWGWTSAPAFAMYAASLAGVVLFVLVERAVGDHALLPFRLFRVPAFSQVNVINFLGGIGAFTPVLLIPLYLQIVKELSPVQAGLLLLPQSIAMTVGAKLCGPVIAKTGRYKVLLAPGLAVVSLTMFAFSVVDRSTPLAFIVLLIVVMGLGLGVFMQTVLTALQNSVPPGDLGIASGMYGFSRQIGGIAGTAIFISLLFSLAATRIVDSFRAALSTPDLAAALADPAVTADPVTTGVVAGLRDGTSGVDLNDTSVLQRLDDRIAGPILDGMSSSLNTVFLVIAVLVALAAGLALVLSEKRRAPAPAKSSDHEKKQDRRSLPMKAAAFSAPGGPEVLEPVELPAPEPGPGEVRVQVKAAGVQPTDLAVREGWTPPGLTLKSPQVIGNEFAGVVDEVGAGVTGVSVGDEVLGFRSLECYAEFVVVPADQIVPKPASLAWEVAAGLSGAGQTASTAVEELGVGEGDVFLVHAAAGAVGTVAVQLAKRAGATVIGTASEANHEYLRSLGVIPVTYGEGLADRVRAVAPDGVTVSLDAAGADGLRAAVELVPDKNRIGTIVAFEIYQELGVRWIGSKRSAARLAELTALAASGELKIQVRRVYSLAEAAEAHREVGTGHGRGKVVLGIG